MTTPWYTRFLELIGFDILLIGALFILAVLIARELLKTDPPFVAFKRAWDAFCNLFGLNTNAEAQAPSLLQTAKAIGGGAAILMLAAAAGMVLDGVAHRVVDYDPEQGLSFSQIIKFDVPDDHIKRKAFESVTVPSTEAMRQAKELYQHAYLRVLDSGRQDIKTVLSRDELLLKLFRVMLVLSSLLSLFVLGTVFKNHLLQRLLLLLLFVFTSFLFLYLWSEQSRHYYKRVFHAYALIDGKASPTGFLLITDPKPGDCGKGVEAPDRAKDLKKK